MRIGVPKETKTHEYRVGLTPASVTELVARGHEVLVERGAGAGIDFADSQYARAGARLVDTAAAFSGELVVKVKEPSLEECARLSAGQVLFTYLHLAAAQPQDGVKQEFIGAGGELLERRRRVAPGLESVAGEQLA